MSFGFYKLSGEGWRIFTAVSDKIVHDATIKREKYAVDYIKCWFALNIEGYSAEHFDQPIKIDMSGTSIDDIAIDRIRKANYSDHGSHLVLPSSSVR